MPAPRPTDEVKSIWKSFVHSIRTRLTELPEQRHPDQVLRVKEAALTLAESDGMVNEIEAAYRKAVLGTANEPTPQADVVEVVMTELEAFPIAVGVHEQETKASTVKPGGFKKLCAAGKTILGSVKEVFELTPFGKGVIEVLKESMDLVAGD
jgi:hypothetical protein